MGWKIALGSLAFLASAVAGAAAEVSTRPDGDFSVGENGDARFHFAVAVPPGIGGGRPELSLTYSSQRDDDRLSPGWRLQGLSAITRCPAIPATDGFRGTVRYDAGDVYCLDGQRLINVQGAYGSPGSVYRTELETWRQATASNDLCGSGPCSFTVAERSGGVSLYGTTADSRVLAVGRPDVRVWALASSADPHGNTISFSYTQTPATGVGAAAGQFYVQQIAYTTHPGAGLNQANRFVRFLYGPRQQPLAGYVGGSRVWTLALLTNVQSFVGSTLVQDLRLSYDETDTGTGRPVLTSMQRCAATGASAACLPPTLLTWQGPARAGFQAEGLLDSLPAVYEAVFPADFNGDGKGDLAFVTADASTFTLTPLISTGAALEPCPGGLTLPRAAGCRLSGSGPSACALLPAQIDGDSRTDLIYVFPDPSRLAFAVFSPQAGGCSFTTGARADFNLPAGYSALWPMDANGDGITDLVPGFVDASTSTQTVVTLLGSVSGFTQSGSLDIPIRPNQRLWPAEVDGNGMLDLVQAWHASGGSIQLSTFLADGESFDAGPTTDLQSGSVSLAALWPLDVNGDGKSDLVQAWAQNGSALELSTFFADGAGDYVCEQPAADGSFTSGCTTDTGNGLTGTRAFWPMDADGDGRIDLMQAEKQGGSLGLVLYRNVGAGFDTGQETGATLAETDGGAVWPVDYNGDGKTDLIQATSGGGGPVSLTGFRAQGPLPDLLAAVTDGVGGTTTISYLPLSDPAVYSSDVTAAGITPALTYPYRQAPAQAPFQQVGGGKMPLVYEVRRSNEPTRNSSTYSYTDRYFYAGGLVDLASGRGWLGFQSFSKLDLASGRRQVTTLNQAFPLTGTTAEIEYQCDATISSDPLCPEGATETKLSDSDVSYTAVVTARGATAPNPPVSEVRKERLQLTTYDYGSFAFARAKSYQYDAYGNLTLLSDLGLVDADGKNLSVDDDVFTCSAFNDPQDRWAFGYLTDRKVSSSPQCSDFSSFNAATDFSLTHFTYTPTFDVASQAVFDDVNQVDLTTTYNYDAFGNQLSMTLPGGATTTYVYESTYNTYLRCALSPPGVSGLGLASYFGFDPRFGTWVAMTTPLATNQTSCPTLAPGGGAAGGLVNLQCLDAFGRPAALQGPIPALPAGVAGDPNCAPPLVTGSAGAFLNAKVVTLTAFDQAMDGQGRIYDERQDLQDWTVAGTPELRWSRSYVDGLGRGYLAMAEEDPSVGVIATCSNYGAEDKLVRQSIPRYFASDSAVACTATSGPSVALWATSTYDVYGRVSRQTQPAGPDGQQTALTTMSYSNDLQVTVTQAAGQPEALTKILAYDYFNSDRKLVAVTLPQQGNAATAYAYDRLGRLISAVDPATPSNPQGVANTVTYDSLGRQTSVDNPDQNPCLTNPGPACVPGAKALQLAYDPITGLLASTTDAAGRITRFAFDPLGRMISKTLPAGGAGSGTILYGYDDPAAQGVGKMTSLKALDPAGDLLYHYAYAYDAYGNRSAAVLTLDGTSFSSSQVYDPQQRVITEIYPDGFTLVRRYAMGNLQAIRGGGTVFATFSDYAAIGGPQRLSYGNGTASTFSYAPTGQPLGQQVVDATGGKLLDTALSYDPLLQVASLTDNLKPGGVDFSQSFTYALTRLTRASAPGLYGDLSFAYDDAGDLIQKDGYTFTYQAHRLVSGQGPSLPAIAAHYDATGNLDLRTVGTTTWAFQYDVRNRLITAASNDETVLSVPLYDDAGSRLKKLTPDGVVTLYVSPSHQITTFPGGAQETTKIVAGPGGTVATITTAQGNVPDDAGPGVPTTGTLYFHRDYLGSTSLTTGEDGLLASRMAYLPYGGVFEPSTSGPDNFRTKFQGRELDETASLYYFGARYYDPALGRFLSSDTRLASDLTTIDTLNRFAFAVNNPVTFTDPTGNSIWDAIGGFLIGAAEIVLGVAVDVLSDGALEPLGGALIGAGMNGATYSVTQPNSFSWKQYGVEQAEGAAFGVVTGGFGGEAEAGVSAVTGEAAEEIGAAAARSEARTLAAESEGRMLTSSADRSVGAEVRDTAARSDRLGDEATACSASFPAGEEVWLAQGLRRVEQVSGAEVLRSRNSIDGSDAAKPVVSTRQRLTSALLVLDLESDDGASERIVTTPEHPFWVTGRGWVPAGQLTAGQRLATVDGDGVRLTALTPIESAEPVRVYNLEVADFHSYFVGELGLWVHNPLCEADPRRDYKLTEGFYREERQFEEVPVDRFVLSRDMVEAIRPEFRDRLYDGITHNYTSTIKLEKLASIDNAEYEFTPLSVEEWEMTDDDEPVQLYRILDGRHRFIWYVNNNFGKVPVQISRMAQSFE